MQALKPDNNAAAEAMERMLAKITDAEKDQCQFYGNRRQPMSRIEAQAMPGICWQHVGGVIFTQRIIVCAATRYPHLDLILPGARHYSPDMNRLVDKLKEHGLMPARREQAVGDNQGFIDNFGNYWTREQSLIIATNAGQLEGRDKCGAEGELFSEDLY